MVGRFKLELKKLSVNLEFVTISSETVSDLLDKSTILEVGVIDKKLNFVWDGRVDEKTAYKSGKSHPDPSSAVFVIVSTSFSDVEVQSVVGTIQNLNASIKTAKAYIISKSNQNEDNGVTQTLVSEIQNKLSSDAKFCSNPLKWSELSKSTQQELLGNSRFSLQFETSRQEKSILLQDILPENSKRRSELLSQLDGETLNALLKNSKPVLFGKMELPMVPPYFVDKNIEIKNCSKISKLQAKKDIIILLGFSTETENYFNGNAYPHLVFTNTKKIGEDLRANPKSQIFVIREDLESDMKILSLLETSNIAIKSGKCFHVFRNVSGKMYQKLNSGVISLIYDVQDIRKSLFAPQITRNDDEIIAISDKPGVGKSLVLNNMAVQSLTNFRLGNHLVICGRVKEFVSIIEKNVAGKNGKVKMETVLSALACSNEFEREVFSVVLEKHLKIELFLDGLDEVDFESRQLFYSCMANQKQSSALHVTTYITTKIQQADELQRHVNCIEYNIQSYSQDDLVSMMEKYWKWKCGMAKNLEQKRASKELRNFARLCLKNVGNYQRSEITNGPLLCHMIAEMFEEQVVSGNFKLENSITISYINVLETIIENRLEAYSGISKSNMKHQSMFKILQEQMENAHMYFALKLTFGETVANKFRSRLVRSEENMKLINETVLEQGIIVAIEPELTFIHRTFAEYFVAKFVLKVICNEFFHTSPEDPDFQTLLDSIIGAKLHVSKPCNGKDILGNDSDQNGYTFIEDFPGVRAMVDLYLSEHKESILDKLPAHFKEIHARLNDCWENELLDVLNLLNWSPAFIRFKGKGNSKHGHKMGVLFSMLTSQNYLRLLFFGLIDSQVFSLAKYFIQNVEGFQPKYWQRLQQSNKQKLGILHVVAKCLSNGVPHSCNVNFLTEIVQFANWIKQLDASQLETRDEYGNTPLLRFMREYVTHDHCICGERLLLSLVQMGANLSAVDNENNSLFHVVPRCTAEICTVCLDDDFKADRQLVVCLKHTNLCYIVSKCEKFSLDINLANNEGNSPLFTAVNYFGELMLDNLYIWKLMGANFDKRNKDGDSLLHVASKKEMNTDIMVTLLAHGTAVNSLDSNGMTALQIAVKLKNLCWVEKLIKISGTVDVKDPNGKTIFDYETSKQIRKLLKGVKRC